MITAKKYNFTRSPLILQQGVPHFMLPFEGFPVSSKDVQLILFLLIQYIQFSFLYKALIYKNKIIQYKATGIIDMTNNMG